MTLSEHFSQFVSVRREKIDFNNVKIYQRDYVKFDNSLFRDVSIQKWDATYENVNNQFNDFFWKLNGCVERHAPIKELSPKEIKMKSKPWITPDITKLIRIETNYSRERKDNPIMKISKNFTIRREIKSIEKLKDLKKNIMSNILKITVTILKKSPKVSQLNVNGKTVVNPKEIASNRNNFFVNIGPSTESNIPKVGNINPAKFMKDRQQFHFIIAHISEEVLTGNY